MDETAQDLDGTTALVSSEKPGHRSRGGQGRWPAAGPPVVVVARDASRFEQVVADLVAEGLDVTGRALDVADLGAVRALPDLLGPLAEVDVLVSAAGVMSERTATTLRTSDEEWRRVLGTDLDGVLATTARSCPAWWRGAPGGWWTSAPAPAG